MKSLLDGRLKVYKGDITEETADAIVNAANSTLLGGGGVDGAIHRAAGPELLEECRRLRRTDYPDGLPRGRAVLTGAGRLPAGSVIHTVGPVWHGGERDEDRTLASAYRSCLEIARDHRFETIAFPAISTGVYGFPKERAAAIVYRTVSEFLSANAAPKEVRLVYFSEADAELFLRVAGEQ
ncbi:O-acetyl-ADP-ribose deacetylase [Salinispira pacifica]